MTSSSRPKHKPRPGVDRGGRTPLHNAVIDQDAALVRKLLSGGADTNVQDDGGLTPLHFASARKSLEIVRMLLDEKADVDPEDLHGNTPLSNAVFSSRGYGDIIQALRAAGASPHHANQHGVSPLKLARTIANYPISQYFADLP